MTAWVYAVRPDNELQVKIGMSKIPELRRWALEKITGKQLKLIRVWGPFENGRRFERAAHIHFAAWATGKEWFCLDNCRLIELDAVFTNLKDEPKLGVNLSLHYTLIEKIDELAKREADGNRSEMHERLVLEALEARRAVKPHTTQT